MAARWLALLCLLFLAAGCGGGTVRPLEPGEPGGTVYVVNHGWHTGIVVRRADIPEGTWPESRDFPAADYLEVGWGDWDFYQTPFPGPWITFKAGALPTASVLHVVGFARPVADYFAYEELVELKLPQAGVLGLIRFIDQTHKRDGAPRTPALGPGLYGDSRFYPALGRFHLFNNCNAWTVRALAAAGLPVDGFPVITAGAAMDRARQFGTAIR